MQTPTTEYDQFLESKIKRASSAGFEPKPLIVPAFPWQAHVIRWAIRTGRCALFEGCGCGKSLQQLEWARQVSEHTDKPVLLLAPLTVCNQTASEAVKFGITNARVVESAEEITGPGIWITNYDKIQHFDAVEFGGVVLDESSVIKAFDGKMRKRLRDRFADTAYRLCCTATPSPNDYTEFGQHADFLGVCTRDQMLATFFINDTFDTGDWRLKRHAEDAFWEWLASWAACITLPSDIGFSDDGYILPPLNLTTEIVDVDETQGRQEDELFRHATLSATTMHKEMRMTAPARVARIAEIVNASDEQWLVWCNTNDESTQLTQAIAGAVEVKGSDSSAHKVKAAVDFVSGGIRVIVSKPSIYGYGMNLQCCHNIAFVGLSYSFEDFYQALRRSYRFGQTREVNAVIVQAATEGPILQAIKRKMAQHEEMQARMKIASKTFKELTTKPIHMKTDITTAVGENWTLHHGDCVRVASEIEDESIDFSIFSPPFADLFTYSDDVQDMGNCEDMRQFMAHFELLVKELARIIVPGREVAVHCLDLLSTKWKHGRIEFQDFSGEIIRAFWRHGFLFHSRITIWKSPVTEMQRTKAHGLLHKTLTSDSSGSRVGSPDYLLVFRKDGESAKPVVKDKTRYPVSWWQEVASPVWMTVDQGRVLNRDGAREAEDEKHICPLQLDVIERAIELWTNENDLVFSPFTGIGSEGVGALTLNRRFVGSELKESYFKQAILNMQAAKSQLSLF